MSIPCDKIFLLVLNLFILHLTIFFFISDVKDNYLHQDDITRVMDSGHEECRVTLGRTATENEEDTLEKAKDTAAPDSLGMTKPHS